MKFKKALLATTAVATLLPAALSLHAANDSATFQVRAQVAQVCKIDSAADLDFGLITAATAADYTASGNVLWRCTNGTAATLSLDGGTTSGDITARAMNGATVATDLAYQLYTDATHLNLFGDGVNGSTVAGVGTGMGLPAGQQSTTVYGQILDADASLADPDNYSDTVTVTLTF